MSLVQSPNIYSELENCKHCSEKVFTPYSDNHGHLFCCNGCKTVYEILNENSLNKYYQLKKESGTISRAVPSSGEENFNYLDHQTFIDNHCVEESTDTISLRFYLEGVHCIACLWLIEKLPELVENLIETRLNMSKSTLKIIINKKGSFAKAASKLNQLGYRPHPLLNEETGEQYQLTEERKLLIRMGVAAACAMNIMIYAVSIYAGATGVFAQAFSWISMLLCLPVIFYSSQPFYSSALSALRMKSINIDIPLSFAIIFGFIAGCFNTFRGVELNYFDSISTLVFLILFSRYLLRKAQQQGLNTTTFSQFFTRGIIRRYNENTDSYEQIHEKYLLQNDLILVNPGENIPADGLLEKGSTKINCATLTGEGKPIQTSIGENVFAGTQNIEHPINIRVKQTGRQTKIGKILDQVEEGWKHRAPIVNFSDKIAKYFVGSIFVLSILTFSYFFFFSGLEIAFSRSLALIIVTCPCALGLATPLAFTRSLNLAAKKGMIIKNEETLEKIKNTKRIYLDKTGTLTYGNFQVVSWDILKKPTTPDSIHNIVFSMEQKSKHPIAKSIMSYFDKLKTKVTPISLDHYEEILGEGLIAKIHNHTYHIKGLCADEPFLSQVGLFENGHLICKITLRDTLRPESKSILSWLKNKKFSLFLLSGDRDENVQLTGAELNLKSSQVISEASPSRKADIIEKYPSSIMIGDGANDALALTKASVGIAVQGSIDISLRAADVYLTTPGIAGVKSLILLSKNTMSLIYRNLTFSLIYNIIGAYLSIIGLISPLWAAILMPLSSLTVILSTIRGTPFLRSLNKGLV